MLSMGAGLIYDFIRNILAIPFCPYHFVHTILSNTILSVYHFVHTILYVPFCPLPFCPRTDIIIFHDQSTTPLRPPVQNLGVATPNLPGLTPLIHTYIYTYMYIHHTYIHTYTHIHRHIHTYMHSCMHTYIHTYPQTPLKCLHHTI